MKILGIDPGSNVTGYGLLEFNNQNVKVIEVGTIEPGRKERFETRIAKVYAAVVEIMAEYQPDVVVLEKLFAHYKHPITACVMGHVRGVICLACAQKNVLLVEHSVKRIRKAVTGNGNATKIQTQKVVTHQLGIAPDQMKLDASDALALALGYLYMERFKGSSLELMRVIR